MIDLANHLLILLAPRRQDAALDLAAPEQRDIAARLVLVEVGEDGETLLGTEAGTGHYLAQGQSQRDDEFFRVGRRHLEVLVADELVGMAGQRGWMSGRIKCKSRQPLPFHLSCEAVHLPAFVFFRD